MLNYNVRVDNIERENNGVVVEEEVYRNEYVAPTTNDNQMTIAQYMYEIAGTLD